MSITHIGAVCDGNKTMQASYIPQTTGKYKKDYRRCEKRGWNMKLLDDELKNYARESR